MEDMNKIPEHKVIWCKRLPSGVYGMTIPIPFWKPIILARPNKWNKRPDYRAHEYVHLMQIRELGIFRYMVSHAVARVKSVSKWICGHRPYGSGWRGFMRAFWAEEEPIETRAYNMQYAIFNLMQAQMVLSNTESAYMASTNQTN